jgi:hypothetical protein
MEIHDIQALIKAKNEAAIIAEGDITGCERTAQGNTLLQLAVMHQLPRVVEESHPPPCDL